MLQSKDNEGADDSGGRPPEPFFHGARGLAVKILTRVEQSDAYLDKLLNRELAAGELNDADKRLLNEIATGVLRWQERLDWVLTGFYHGEFTRCIPVVRNALRVALYQILFLDRIPYSAAVNESVEIVKRLKGARSASVVNGVLRSIIRKLASITYPERLDDEARYLAIMFSHPLWLVRRWHARFGGAETEALLEANNRRPHLALRINPRRSTVDAVLHHLQSRGLAARQSELMPGVVLVDGMAGIGADAVFRDGGFSIQDEGAMLASALTGARPGMRVVDLCAAPGGKTAAIAEALDGQGQVIAVDKFEAKLRLVAEAVQRLHLGEQVTMVTGDARTIQLEPADVVLVDAPCSGLGVLAKKPDIKWKRTPEDIEAMAALQAEILRNAATLVRPGGHLVYTTCTIEPAENEDVIRQFLAEHPDFELEPASTLLPEQVVTPEGFLATLPSRHGLDGTFGARMRRLR